MPAVASSGFFESSLGTGGSYDLLCMDADEFTRLGATLLDGFVVTSGDSHVESFGAAVVAMCSKEEYEAAATTLAQTCAASEDPNVRQSAVTLYAHLHSRQIIERDPPGDGQAEAVIWEQLMGDASPAVAINAAAAVTAIAKRLGVVMRRGRPELGPALEALAAVLPKD